jgi:hypothetical protein
MFGRMVKLMMENGIKACVKAKESGKAYKWRIL